ncbi:MAG: proline--tRNA ligase [Candidatus Sumerlaeales bacterium]|nr:proline--tRNA ligase [Candidatus Sumerlaeales bacterium]
MAKDSKEQSFIKEITPRSEDFSQWYIDIVRKAELADYTSMKGCMVIKPYGYAIWENMRDQMDKRIKDTGHMNAYFPLFVPESLLNKEAEHIAGFAPEVAWVTQGGNEKLEERLAIRPTSEAIICSIYADWVHSWRDLPILINQWANVVRWEKVTRLFLRTTEFQWQEGHTCHRTHEEAVEETVKMLAVYKEYAENVLAMPAHAGIKTSNERFPGAQETYCIEALMSDGKALQAGTSHDLGQHFSKMFNILFEDQDNERKYVWQTSWGTSMRMLGGVIMTHGDENGLILPPKIAPYQVVIIPIFKAANKEEVCAKAQEVAATLRAAGVRVFLDDREQYSPGWKYNQWEMKGVPLRLELGPKDIEKQTVFSARRDTRVKAAIPMAQLTTAVPELLNTIQNDMLQKAINYREEMTTKVDNFEDFQKTIETKRGFVVAGWDGTTETELKIKELTKATIRFIPMDENFKPIPAPEGTKCVLTGEPAKHLVYFARSY